MNPAPAIIHPVRETLASCQAEVERLCEFPYYAEAYRESEPGYWSTLLEWMGEDFDANWPRLCLDVGCAYGTLTLVAKQLAPACELYGVDFTPDYMSARLAAEHEITFWIRNVELEQLPCPWNKYDVILLTEVIEHFNFQAAPTLRKLRDALAPGGRIYLSTPDALEWGRLTTQYPDYLSLPMPESGREVFDGHVWQFSEDELRQAIYEAGLKVTRFGFSAAPGRPRHFNAVLEAA